MVNTVNVRFVFCDEGDDIHLGEFNLADVIIQRNADGTVEVMKSRHTALDVDAVAAWLGLR